MLFLSLGKPAVTIAIESPSEIEIALQKNIFSQLTRLKPDGATPSKVYRIEVQAEKYLLYRNSRLTHRNKNPDKIIYALEYQIVADFLKAYPKFLKFHAASLVQNENGYLFIGDSGSGKTSLALILMSRGWQFYSDEFGIVHPHSRQLFPFPRNPIIKNFHPLFPDIEIPAECIRIDDSDVADSYGYLIPPRLLGARYAASPKPLKSIFILESRPHENSFKVERIGQTAAFNALLKLLFNPHQIRKQLLESLSALIETRPVYRLITSKIGRLTASEQRQLEQAIIKAGGRDD